MAKKPMEIRTVSQVGGPDSPEPALCKEVPTDATQHQGGRRRKFLGFLVLTSFALVVGLLSILVPDWVRRWLGFVPVRRVASLEPGHPSLPHLPVGGFVEFCYPYGQDSCVLARMQPDQLVAYDRRCTHLACPVVPQVAIGRLVCPCHQGEFDLQSGQPLKGPPGRPLQRVTLEVRDGLVFATAVEPRTL
jgi:nitrite reductase/ring-hydroxylating ferredoxin subunit